LVAQCQLQHFPATNEKKDFGGKTFRRIKVPN
jgi:hypothetical protein